MRTALTLLVVAIALGSAGPTYGALCEGAQTTIVGTAGSDRIVGTPGDDVIQAGGGADVVQGGLGADIICGGPGGGRRSGRLGLG